MLNALVSASNVLPVAAAIKLPATEGQRAVPPTGSTASERSTSGGQEAPVSQPARSPGVEDTRGLQALVQSSAREEGGGLSEAEEELVRKLAARDREVRDHEQAHARVGGEYAGEPTYTYQTGPDGQRYAVGGAVAIDTAPVRNDPAATIQKMEVVKAAALAPAEPSAADRRIAAIAEAQRLQAVGDLNASRIAERDEGAAETDSTPRSGRVEAFLEMLAALADPVRNARPQVDLVA